MLACYRSSKSLITIVPSAWDCNFEFWVKTGISLVLFSSNKNIEVDWKLFEADLLLKFLRLEISNFFFSLKTFFNGYLKIIENKLLKKLNIYIKKIENERNIALYISQIDLSRFFFFN